MTACLGPYTSVVKKVGIDVGSTQAESDLYFKAELEFA